MRIEITQDHIDRANQIREDVGKNEWYQYAGCRSCPISLALHELGLSTALVFHNEWSIDDSHTFHLPPSAQQFIRDFDAGQEVIPCRVNL